MIPENTPRLETERLILRRFTEGDLPALFAIYSDVEANTFLPWFPLKDPAEAAALYERRYAAVYRQPHGYAWAVCLRADDVPIGYVHVRTEDSCGLGYGLRRQFWGRGIMSEAAGAAVARLRADGLPFITATHDVNNPRSGGVMRRVGMRYQYSYVEQWQPKDFPVTFRMYQLNLDGDEARVYRKYWAQYPEHFVEAGLNGPGEGEDTNERTI